MPDVHSKLPPSSAKRWINCPPSAKINECDRRDSAFTREGTIAHTLAEIKARKRFIGGIGPRTMAAAMDATKADLAQLEAEYPDESLDGFNACNSATDVYVDCIETIWNEYKSPYIALEQRVDFSDWAPGGFGTADCVLIANGVLNVIDFKYGKGVGVSAKENYQMMCYALGAYVDNNVFFDIQTVNMVIVQPRISAAADVWSMPMPELLNWADTVLKPAAELAAQGKGEMKCGPWCKWCANEGRCRARANHYTVAIPEAFDITEAPDVLTLTQIGEALRMGAGVVEWYGALKDYALKACLNGDEIPGYKAVTGKSGARKWTDSEAAFKAVMGLGVDEAMLYERKPLTLAAVEKLIGKPMFAKHIAQYTVTPAGTPTLAEAGDKRPAVVNKSTAADDFS